MVGAISTPVWTSSTYQNRRTMQSLVFDPFIPHNPVNMRQGVKIALKWILGILLNSFTGFYPEVVDSRRIFAIGKHVSKQHNSFLTFADTDGIKAVFSDYAFGIKGCVGPTDQNICIRASSSNYPGKVSDKMVF